MKVISYCMYRHYRPYLAGMLANAVQAREFYPGWRVRVYADAECHDHVRDELMSLPLNDHIETVKMGRSKKASGMMWRHLVAEDRRVERFIVRDADSTLSRREQKAVEEWTASGRALHVIHDGAHCNRLMMGGMWGGTDRLVALVAQLGLVSRAVERFDMVGHYDDELWLARNIYPLFAKNVQEHYGGRIAPRTADALPLTEPMVGGNMGKPLLRPRGVNYKKMF